jgi:hypothetical protein
MTAGSLDQLVALAQMQLATRDFTEPLTRSTVEATVDQLLRAFPQWRVVREAAIVRLSMLFSTFIGEASVLRGNDAHVLWLDGRRPSIEWRFWDRYRKYLIQRAIPIPAVNSLNRVTDRTLELIGNPADTTPFNRRGMVVGDVQAGKTANYTGLICKAADAGYKVIIVLAGLYNNLRSQTQMRLDDGFIGKISVPSNEMSNATGAGLLDPSLRVDWATNRTEAGDFHRRVMHNFGVHPGGTPMLFVIKKLKSPLESVLAWINAMGNGQDDQGKRVVGVPLLMIDDEADNASVDTKEQAFKDGVPDPEHEPSAINSRIRRILERFDQTSYVGYTATPFANIFIHPDAQTDAQFQDLFPRDFIINIQAPDNYVGASRVFGSIEDDETEPNPGLPQLIVEIKDHVGRQLDGETSGWMPPGHRKEHIPLYDGEDRVPPSLEKAIACFALSIAARRARGHESEHNSMLVHVTRYQAVQHEVIRQIEASLYALRDDVRYGGAAGLARLQAIWDSEFVDVTRALALPDAPPIPWGQVAAQAPVALDLIRVREINGSSGDILDYDRHREGGLSVIAVGGDKLSRGLTLEGLSVSYFLRGSKMYDTLMQMGRWFGYRDGYLDLCRLFTTADLTEWYEHIALASEELRREFDRMETIRATPREFGLKVRSHSTMTVTSRVKMLHGTKIRISFAGSVSETTVFGTDDAVVASNYETANDLVQRLGSRYDYTPSPAQDRGTGSTHRWAGSHYWSGVPADEVLVFLGRYRTHPDAPRANASLLSRYVERQNALKELLQWNILLVGGEGPEQLEIGGLRIDAVLRQPKGGYGLIPYRTIPRGERFVVRRLLNPRDEGVDIGTAGYEAAMRETTANPPKKRRADAGPPTKPSELYLRRARSPTTGLLMLYPLARETTLPSQDGGSARHRFLDATYPVMGLGISFPWSDRAEAIDYVVNSVWGESDDESDT